MKKNKILVLVLAMIMLVGGVVGGTLAWLVDKTQTVKNTFTPSTIDITLEEKTGEEYKMIPGCTLEKDPIVTVKEGSEPCYLFIKVMESGGVTIDETKYIFDDFITYAINSGWTQYPDTDIYYRMVKNETPNDMKPIETDMVYNIIFNDLDGDGVLENGEVENQVGVKSTVTKQMMDALTKDNYPALSFKAAAIQLYKNNTEQFDVEVAFAELPDEFKNN